MEFINFGISDAHKHRTGIYQIKSILNGKYYIGSAVSFYNRWHTHSHHLREGTHFNDHLISHKNKYGISDLIIEILEFVDDSTKLIAREQWWLDNTECLDRKKGFNKCPTAQSQLGREMPDTHREKVGQRSKYNQYRKGFKVSESTKLNISKAQGTSLAQYSIDGKLIKIFEVPWLAEKEGFSRGGILHVVQGTSRKSGGYFWRYLYDGEVAKDLTLDQVGKPSFKKRSKVIVLYGDDDSIIREWKNSRAAAKETNTPLNRVLKMCAGKIDSFYDKKFRYRITYE